MWPFISHTQKKIAEAESEVPQWKMVSASVRGANKKSCQDANYISQLSNEWGVCVVTDGAGSCAHSRVGAKFAARRIGNMVEALAKKYQEKGYPSEKIWEQDSVLAFLHTRSELEFFATKRTNIDVHEYSSTVIAILYAPGHIFIATIGDGRAGYRTADGVWHALFSPMKGTYANETYFLTSRNLCSLIQTHIVKADDIDSIVVMSDGVENYAWSIATYGENGHVMTQNQPFPGFLDPLLAALFTEKNNLGQSQQELTNLLRDHDVLKNETDDKTLIVAFKG
jgi:hypothetical protein